MEGWTYRELPGLILCDVFSTSVYYELGMGCLNHCKQLLAATESTTPIIHVKTVSAA